MNKNRSKREHKINEEIRFPQIRLVGDNVEGGIMSTKEAIAIAYDLGLDLVCLNENGSAPTCKIMDYGKFIFDRDRKKKPPKAKAVKEIKFRPNIGQNDFDIKIKQIIKFLDKGHKVKTHVQFRGREMAYIDSGKVLLLRVAQATKDYGTPESLPNKVVGRAMIMFLTPKK